MSKIKLQDKPIIVGSPIEIEKAVNDIRVELAKLPWVDYPFFIAQRFYRLQDGRAFYYPETYAPELTVGTKQNNYSNYARLTPDNDFKSMFFFLVGPGGIDYEMNQENFIQYPVSIIFSANLELINKAKLDQGLFTQELIREARKILTKKQVVLGLDYSITSETRDIREVYREFSLEDIDTFNRSPMQCFRFDLTIRIQENCDFDPIDVDPVIPTPGNIPNITNQISNNFIRLDFPFEYQIEADGNVEFYDVFNLLPGLSVDANTGLITGTITGTPGLESMSLIAGNENGQDEQIIFFEKVVEDVSIFLPPSNLTAPDVNETECLLNWDYEKYSGIVINIEIFKNGILERTLIQPGNGGKITGFRIQLLTPGSLNTFKIRFINSLNEFSDFSNEITVQQLN